MNLLIKGGRVVDPSQKIDKELDVLIEDGAIAGLEQGITGADAEVFDATGKIVTPGFIDMHVHLREPGYEWKETILTGGHAAAAGGFTTVACMPNTDPPIDNQSVVELILRKAESSPARVLPIGAATKRREGEELTEIAELVERGVVAISDDGAVISHGLIMRRVMEYTKMFDIPVINHAEDPTLHDSGIMNEGFYSTKLGLEGRSATAEDVMIYRDLRLAELTACHYHAPHVTTAESVQLLRRAKERGIRVTAEATPHHLVLTHDATVTFNTNTKVKPPLRRKEDRDALREGLTDGTIDAIASDHAPHHEDEKRRDYASAPFGVIGLETTVPVLLDRLVRPHIISLDRFVELLSTNPATILGLESGNLKSGSPADITILDLEATTTIDASRFASKSRNTPFNGWEVVGCPYSTIVAGKIVWQRDREPPEPARTEEGGGR